jgi:hypothetical protein
MLRVLLVGIAMLMLTTAANASWQLIPGKTYDGHRPISVYREPCWSAASSKCAWEQSRQSQQNRAKRGSR